MLKLIFGILTGGQEQKIQRESEDPKVRVWTESEPDRVRTFEEETISHSTGIVFSSITVTRELATSRQTDFLKRLGHSADGLDKDEASLLLTRALRPIDYALSKTFKNIVVLEKEHLRALQVAIAHWNYLPKLPRYGPHFNWDELNAREDDPHRELTKEERIALTDIAYKTIPPQAFLSLTSNGVSRHKKQLDEMIRNNESKLESSSAK
jgi:hypothetical protein